MAIIDPSGLFNGDRLRHCSDAAQLHWPRLFLASDGFGRLEINHARIIGHAYPTFQAPPSQAELQAFIHEYSKNHLLFLYEVDGRLWGQWDTRSEFLPRYKTTADRRSPIPPDPAFAEWKKRYREENKSFPKCCGNISETFHAGVYGVGVGVGEGIGVGVEKTNTCAAPKNGAACVSVDSPPFDTLEPDPPPEKRKRRKASKELTAQQSTAFDAWWQLYPKQVSIARAKTAFAKRVTAELVPVVMAATRAQLAPGGRLNPDDQQYIPYPSTWLNGEEWNNSAATRPQKRSASMEAVIEAARRNEDRKNAER